MFHFLGKKKKNKKNYNFDENCTFYPISYAFAVPIHPKLNIEKIYIVRSFNHTFDQLNDVSYLPDGMLPYFDPIAACQLRDCALAVYKKKDIFSLNEMFSCEIKFVVDLLKKWLGNSRS